MEERKGTLGQVLDCLDLYNAAVVGMRPEDNIGLANLLGLLSGCYDEAYRAKQEGRPLAWINFGIPSEIFWAMDIVPVVVDVTAGLVAPTLLGSTAMKYIDIAHEQVPDYICGNNKVLMGALLSGEISAPDVFVHPANPCDSNLATYPVIAKYSNFPYFCVDMPYYKNERGTEFVANELKRMISFLEKETNRKLDFNRLRQAMEYSNLAHEYFLKLAALREAVPCPYSSIDVWAEYPALLCMAGRPELVDYFEKRYEITKEKVAKGEGGITTVQEKYRTVWIYGAPAFDVLIFLWLENEYGAVAVGNMNSNFVMKPVEDISDYDKIMTGLAKKTMLMPMTRECGGPWEDYLDPTIDLLKRYKADLAIFGGNTACKASWAVIKMVKDRIQDELGIPTLILEMDLFDPRIASSDSIKEQFTRIFETVLQR
ncbi:MAG: 2-hydroxyacyl-CoA dehydratase family protein [Dehalococcoidia bacterium]|jgi:benzoyl-CoA reductase/2-hydroxyglutaryl-CoA dehydratase subunit BcrC/BadD/HgdB